MKRLELNAKNVIAIILMAVDLFVIVSCGYGVADNRGGIQGRSAATVEVPGDMYLTFKDDVSLDSDSFDDEEKIFIPKDTVIKPNYIWRNRIDFYFPADDYTPEECAAMSYDERKEKGISYLHAEHECFKESEEIQRLCDEASERGKVIRTKTIMKIFIPVLGIGLVWLIGWFFLTRLLCKKQMYVLLYVLDIVILPFIYCGFSMFLIH